MSVSLFEHNEIAYKAAVSMMNETGRAAVIHPTGTGKSFIGFKLCEDNPAAKVCWLSPSEYIFRTQLENLKKSCGEIPENVIFYTYSKLTFLSDEELADISPDYIILDEFHRCGADIWGKSVLKLLDMYNNTPVLGLSATNIRYLDNQRDMAEELFGGCIASEMTLGEAIVRGILKSPKYVISVFSYRKELEKLEMRVRNSRKESVISAADKYLEALRRTLEQSDGLDEIFRKHIRDKSGRFIVFCANYSHLNEMTELAGQWFAKVDSAPHIYRMYSDNAESAEQLEAFKLDNSKHLKLLYCIDMLNEGVHIDDISGVILLRPTVSPTIYKQQIGRALSVSGTSEPVIFDIVLNFENLYSVGAIEDEMRNSIDFFRYTNEDNRIVVDNFDVIDEVRDCRKIFEELESLLNVSWAEMYSEAEDYYREVGNLEMPRNYFTEKGHNLGHWLDTQKTLYRTGRLSEKKAEKLNALHISWQTVHERFWDECYKSAESYYKKHGDLNVKLEDEPSLTYWIRRQRMKKRSGQLTGVQIQRLDAIGMVWSYEDSWLSKYRLAAEYYEVNGNLDIPASYVTNDGVALGSWYRSMIERSKAGTLSEEQLEMLGKIGFTTESIIDRNWDNMYRLAQKYFELHGDLNINAKYVTEKGEKLGVWISGQRFSYKNGRLSEDRIKKLEQIGMVWSRDSSRWNVGYEYAVKYFEKNGNINIPASYVTEDGYSLGVWINSQRKKHSSGKLSEIQTKQLEELNINWNPNDSFWEQGFGHAEEYFSENGDLMIADGFICEDGFKLSAWIKNQRTAYKQGRLDETKAARLESISMVWSPQEQQWQLGYDHACEHFKSNSDLLVPKNYKSADGFLLGSWITSQRNAYKAQKLSEDKVRKLESIGMVWSPYEQQWNVGYEHAKQFYKANGNVDMSASYVTVDGYRLGEWLRSQKRSYQKGTLETHRIEKLKNVGLDLT